METGAEFPYAYVAVGVLLYSALMTAVYIMTVAIRAWFPDKGYNAKANEGVKDPNWEMKLPLLLFMIAIIAIGLYSQPLMEIFQKVANGII